MRYKAILILLFLIILAKTKAYEISWNNPDPHGNYFSDVWAHQPNKVYFAGDFNRVWIYSEGVWRNQTLPTNERINSIWGFSDEDIYAVGSYGFIGHWNGEEWIQQDSNTNEQLFDVWGIIDSQVYAVGANGTILNHDGTTWTKIAGLTENDLFSVWGLDGDHVYVVGFGGTILKFDDLNWSQMQSNTEYAAVDIWGTDPDNLYAVGWDVMLHFDGLNWNELDIGYDVTAKSIMGFSESDIYIGGTGYNSSDQGCLWHWDGVDWSQFNVGTDYTDSLDFVWGLSPDNIYVTGIPNCVYHFNGSDWISLRDGPRINFESIEVINTNNQYLAGFYYSISSEFCVGEIYHWDGVNLERKYRSHHEFWLKDLISFSNEKDNSIFAVDYSQGLVLEGDGENWNEIDTGFDCRLSSIWGMNSEDLYVSGVDGIVLHWDGTNWSQMTTNTTQTLHTIWGYSSDNIFAGGSLGGIFHWDGDFWSPMVSGTTNEIYDVWGLSYNCTYAISSAILDRGELLYFDGNNWTANLHVPDCIFHKVRGTSQDNIFISATDDNSMQSIMFHWDGQIWTEHPIETNWASIRDFEIHDNTIFGVGSNGAFIEIGTSPETPTPEPTITPTSTPIFTATLTPTRSPTPSPSPTATIPELGLYLSLSQTQFHSGDRFLLSALISNPGPENFGYKPITILLDVYSNYYWFPSWDEEFDFNLMNLGIGIEQMEILNFIWPENCGAQDGIFIYGAILSDSFESIIGKWSQVEFGFSDS